MPEEAERDIISTTLACVRFGLLMAGALAAVGGYLAGIHGGREFLAQPLRIKWAIVVVALIFLYNIGTTILRGRRSAVTSVLMLGMAGIAVFWLCAIWDPENIAVDKLHWWYVSTSGWKAYGSW